ncbi:TIGR02285 family protein [Pseudomonas sp. ADAK2]|uniref:TIGR02285 family protein n=1 Tax=unclassified Pseudomonas TaxID=196821 RepID=UPI001464302C|nr:MULTISPECIES: TIGR02285 family protein [unclassified Pseudomonas]QJI42168.1 TIGR02285 family protein [Pseudomonas sp. ADAK7]QJI48471.1 TIGR02285 family protein [Pseudomonas sp. ADAK2]
MTRNRSQSCVKTGPFKLKRLLSVFIKRVSCGYALALLLLGLSSTVWAQPKETLIWLLRDLPPLTIFEGPEKGQGVVDQLMPLLIAGMPQYAHTRMRVNRARGMQMLREESFTCDPSLIWSKEREQWIAFSIPVFRAVSNGLAVRQEDRPELKPFLVNGEVDLAALLANGSKKLGAVAERSYGQFVDAELKQAPANTLTLHYGNDALGSLLQMQRLGRLLGVLGYWPEIRYLAQQEQIADNELVFYPVRGAAKYISTYIGCSNTAQGRQAISEINQLLRTLPHERLAQAYAKWLDPQRRGDYLEQAKAFFEQQTGQ